MKADFLENASNVYSTANFIVKQVIGIVIDDEGQHYTTTTDYFYKRTRERDKLYCKAFLIDNIVSGGRIYCDITKRKYVD